MENLFLAFFGFIFNFSFDFSAFKLLSIYVEFYWFFFIINCRLIYMPGKHLLANWIIFSK